MSIKNMIGILIAYLKAHLRMLVFSVLWTGIFVLVLFLYNQPVEAVAYAFLLSTSAGVVFVGVDIYRFYKTHLQLIDHIHCKNLDLKQLPEPADLIEKDYQDLIKGIQDEKMARISQWDQKMTDLMDYYTLWTHQIKTPIAAMKLVLQEAQDIQHDTEDQSVTMTPQIKLATQELFKIERYVESAIQYARLESISSDFRFEKVLLDDVIKQGVKKFAPIFIHNKIALVYEPLHLEVLSDEKWLLFVLEQILSNALKYTSQGRISIYLDKDSEQTLVIEDTGMGIHAEDLPRVFEKGFTGYNGRMDQKSTGIGLYLCKQILDKLSHTIDISSQVEIGTKVKINLSSVQIGIE